MTKSCALVLLFVVLALLGCSNDSPTASRPDPGVRTMSLDYGDSELIPRSVISLTFQGDIDDARCPADAFCFTPGHASIELTVSNGQGSWIIYPYVDYTGAAPEGEAYIPIGGGSNLEIALGYLDPWPESSTAPPPSEEYSVLLNIRQQQ